MWRIPLVSTKIIKFEELPSDNYASESPKEIQIFSSANGDILASMAINYMGPFTVHQRQSMKDQAKNAAKVSAS
jgi:hypothetical protein